MCNAPSACSTPRARGPFGIRRPRHAIALLAAFVALAPGGGGSAGAQDLTPIVTGVVNQVQQETGAFLNQFGTFAVYADGRAPYGILVRIWPASANRFIDATIYQIADTGEWAYFQWTATDTDGSNDARNFQQNWAGVFSLWLTGRTPDWTYAWWGTTWQAQGAQWVPYQGPWSTLTFVAGGGGIDALVAAIQSPTALPPGGGGGTPGTTPTPGRAGSPGSTNPSPGAATSPCDGACNAACQQQGFRSGRYDPSSGVVCMLGQLSGGSGPTSGCACQR